MSFDKNIRGHRIDGNVSVSTVSGDTFSASTYLNVGGGSGVHVNPTYLSIGALNTGGYNGLYGFYNARTGNAGLNRIFVGETNSFASNPALELRGYNSGANDPMAQIIVNSVSTVGSYTGTSVPKVFTTNLNASLGYGGFGTGNLVKTVASEISIIGSASTNYSTKLDSNGFKITTNSNIANTNTYPFSVNDKFYFETNASYNRQFVYGPNGNQYIMNYADNSSSVIEGAALSLVGDSFAFLRAAGSGYAVEIFQQSGPTLKLDQNGVSIGVSTRSGLAQNAANYLTVAGNVRIGSNVAATHKFEVEGTVMISTLTGTTTRLVETNISGETSATKEIIDAFITTTSVLTAITASTSWSTSGTYVGPTITGTYAGQYYYDSNYKYEAVDDNVFIRISRGNDYSGVLFAEVFS
jgi:hypothetical protein